MKAVSPHLDPNACERKSRDKVEHNLMGRELAALAAPVKNMVAKDVLEAIDQGFALFDENDRLVVANPVYKQIFAGIVDIIEPGVPFETLVRTATRRGQNVESFSKPESWVQERLAKHRAASGVFEHKFADGRWIQVRERRTARGQIIGTYTDVTPLVERSAELARTRDSLKLLTRRMQAMIEASSDWVWTSDAGGNVTCKSQSSHADEGPDAAPHIATALTALIGQHIRAGGQTAALPRRFIHPVKLADGSTLTLGINGKAIHNDDGTLEGFVGTASDETEKIKLQRDATQRTALLEGMLSSIEHGVIVISPDARVVLCNHQAELQLGLNLVPGMPLAQAQPGLSGSWVEHVVHWSATGTGPAMPAVEAVSATGAMLVVRGSFMSTGGAVLTVADVTEQRRAMAQNHQSQKLIALGELTGGVAHEFNNLLTSITGFAQLARDFARQPDMVEECLAEVIGAADHATQLTRQMLTFGRKDQFKERTVVGAGIVHSLSQLMKPLLPEGIRFELVIEDDSSCIRVDVAHLSQALMNLVLNARDSMALGGTVTLRVHSGVGLASPQIGEMAPRLVFSVSDQGTGIDEATLPRIFDPFFTTKEQGKGTGLGLSVVHGIVQQSGGTIAVDSAVGRGTTVSIQLPVVSGAPELPQPPPPPAARGRGQTIAVVEDEPGVRRLVERTLTVQGYRVLAACDHAGLESILAAEAAAPDMLLTDVVLPGRSGPEIAANLRHRFPSLAVLFMSGYVAPGIQNLELLDDDAKVLSKPFAAEALSHAVARALGTGCDAGAGIPTEHAL